MPAIRMLGRRWSFATDDVPMLGFFPTLFHGLWALVLVIIWVVFGKHRDCYDGTTYTVVLAGLLATFTLFTAVGCWTIYEGLKGARCFMLSNHVFTRATPGSAHAGSCADWDVLSDVLCNQPEICSTSAIGASGLRMPAPA